MYANSWTTPGILDWGVPAPQRGRVRPVRRDARGGGAVPLNGCWPAAQNCNEGPHVRGAFPAKECTAESGSLQPTSAACAGHFTTASESANANEAAAGLKTSSSASAGSKKKKKNRGRKKAQRQEMGPAAPRAAPPQSLPKPQTPGKEGRSQASMCEATGRTRKSLYCSPSGCCRSRPTTEPCAAAYTDSDEAWEQPAAPASPGASPPRVCGALPDPPLREGHGGSRCFHPIHHAPAPAAQTVGSQSAASASRPPSRLGQRTVSPSAVVPSRVMASSEDGTKSRSMVKGGGTGNIGLEGSV